MSGAEKRIFRFGVFEADASSGELRKAGMRLRVQEKPFQVLMLLLEHPGEVVTREEVRQKLWPSDTFVDFDHSLNTIVNKIRDALDDSAANPRFIETLSKRGYRFLVPVESTSHRSDHPAEKLIVATSPPAIPSRSTFHLTDVDELPVASRRYVRALFLLIQIMYLSFYIAALERLPAVQDLLDRMFGHPWVTIVLIMSAGVGIPIRLYLLSAAAFDIKDLSVKFLRLFPGILVLDVVWALAPFLLAPQIGVGLALAFTAALIYVPFAQRTLVLMRQRTSELNSGE
ncbi:MAG TPA: winged helix-turn-helix domain-containing protein [Candidatus Sulfotelmatobacter sp.]|jgi:DNA-binding winged helix-turn-helix (wHTH) protein|nr:winged helix-turn-helix domain-containing protein [Candidatus Sulfotelmatobacter sp.]